MQRVFPHLPIWLLTLFALYACTSTVPPTPVVPQPAAPAIKEQPAPPAAVTEPITPPATVVETPLELPAGTQPAFPAETPSPHIALLLPVHSPIFGHAAEAVQQGFMAAANYKKQPLPVRVYSDFDENSNVVAAYRQAIANGARAVVGPLTRSGVSALAAEKDIPVPTLALNIVDAKPAQQLYYFGMSVESEARQVADLAKQQGLHQAIIITTPTALSQRLQASFEDEWAGPGRGILREIEFDNDPSVFADIADITDTVVFLASDADKARLIRPYLSGRMEVYATSQIFVGNEDSLINYDLNGIRFVDMPWLLQPDHPAVMVYPRSNPTLTADRERLYALGIDSYRLIQTLLAGKATTALPLDGVSGQIRLVGHTFQRMAIPAVFVQGRAQLPGAPASSAPSMFPGQANTAP